MRSAGPSGRHAPRSACRHAISGAAAAAFASISPDESTPVTRAPGHRALRSRVTLPAPAPRSYTSSGSPASIRFRRSTAGRRRWSANFRYCAGSQATGTAYRGSPAGAPVVNIVDKVNQLCDGGMHMADRQIDARVADVRRFNRFYTRQIGLLREAYLDSPFSLSETRVLYELAHRERPTATELGRDLGLDAGYLSSILRGFQKRGLLKRTQSEHDGRQSHLALTPRGQAAFAPLNTRSRDEIGEMLGALPAAEQARLVQAMHAIEGILGAKPEPKAPYLLRPHKPGA